MAADVDVVNAARASFGKFTTTMGPGDERLIGFLMRERHTSPFESVVFRFHVKAPMFVFNQWVRHRMSAYSVFSGRYSEHEQDFYVPDFVRTQVGKPGSYTFEPVADDLRVEFRDTVHVHNHMSYSMYEEAIQAGVAKEMARFLLPPTLYTQFIWTVNGHSLMNFLKLRMADDAQYEIREYANALNEYFAETMPVTHTAFEKYWIAPKDDETA